jgi:hypothetical protein
MSDKELNNLLDMFTSRRDPNSYDIFEKKLFDSYKVIVYRIVNRVNSYTESLELLRSVKTFCRLCDEVILQDTSVKHTTTFERTYVRFFRVYTNIWYEYDQYHGLKKLYFRFKLFKSYYYLLSLLNEIIEMKTYSKIMYKYSLLKENYTYKGD